MRKIISLLFILIFCVMINAQTSEYSIPLRTASGAHVTSGNVLLKKYSDTTIHYTMTHQGDGVWKATVPVGTYSLFYNNVLIAKYEKIFIGEDKLAEMAGKFNSGSTIYNGEAVTVSDNAITTNKILNAAVTMPKLSNAVKEYIDGSGGGTITNFPDDITIAVGADCALSIYGTVQLVAGGSASTNTSLLQSKITEVGTGEVYITSTGFIPINTITIPSTINLKIRQGAVLQVQSGQTLTVSGGLDFNVGQQIFDTTGIVDLSHAKIIETYPSMFGASTTASPILNRKAIELSILQAPDKAVVKFSDSMDVYGTVDFSRSNIVLGGNGATLRQTATSCNSIFESVWKGEWGLGDTIGYYENITVKDFRLIGSGLGTSTNGYYGSGIAFWGRHRNVLIENNYIKDMVHEGIIVGLDGVYFPTSDNVKIINNTIIDCGKDDVNGAGIQTMGNHVWIENNYVTGSAFNGVDCNNTSPVIRGNHLAYNGVSTGDVDLNSRNAIYAGSDTTYDGIISNNYCGYSGNSTHKGDGIMASGKYTLRMIISNNLVVENTKDGIHAHSEDSGIDTFSGGNFIITGNAIIGNGTIGDSTSETGDGFGLQIDSRVKNSVISNNTITMDKKSIQGIFVGAPNCLVSNNNISGIRDSSAFGIYIAGTPFGDGSIVSNNILSGFHFGVIYISTANNVSVTNNLMTNVVSGIGSISDNGTHTYNYGNKVDSTIINASSSGDVSFVGSTDLDTLISGAQSNGFKVTNLSGSKWFRFRNDGSIVAKVKEDAGLKLLFPASVFVMHGYNGNIKIDVVDTNELVQKPLIISSSTWDIDSAGSILAGKRLGGSSVGIDSVIITDSVRTYYHSTPPYHSTLPKQGLLWLLLGVPFFFIRRKKI
jgi:hypothetical protein